MTLRVVGAGLARTGTASLKLALEQLLGGPCYHMFELFAHPADIPAWHQAARGQYPAWDELLAGYRAAVDVPASAFWQQLAAANPDALIVLSVRDSAEQWWDSASQTVFNPPQPGPQPGTPQAAFVDMIIEVWRSRIGIDDFSNKAAMIAAYERHNQAVRDLAPPGRLLEWRPGDGWQPIAAALGLPVPERPFPKVNTRSQFLPAPELGRPVHLAATPANAGSADRSRFPRGRAAQRPAERGEYGQRQQPPGVDAGHVNQQGGHGESRHDHHGAAPVVADHEVVPEVPDRTEPLHDSGLPDRCMQDHQLMVFPDGCAAGVSAAVAGAAPLTVSPDGCATASATAAEPVPPPAPPRRSSAV